MNHRDFTRVIGSYLADSSKLAPVSGFLERGQQSQAASE